MASENMKLNESVAELFRAQLDPGTRRGAALIKQSIQEIKIIKEQMRRSEIERGVAEQTWTEAAQRYNAREIALSRQLRGAPLLPGEITTLETSGMKPVGPETGFAARLFNRESNKKQLKSLFEQDIAEILSKKLAQAVAENNTPLQVTPEQVRQVPMLRKLLTKYFAPIG